MMLLYYYTVAAATIAFKPTVMWNGGTGMGGLKIQVQLGKLGPWVFVNINIPLVVSESGLWQIRNIL